MKFTLKAEGFKGLRRFVWSPSGVNLLVGPNGSGKTTALRLLEVLRRSLASDFEAGIALFGPGPMRHLDLQSNEVCALGVEVGDLFWAIAPEHTVRVFERVIRNSDGEILVERGRGERDAFAFGYKVQVDDRMALGMADYLDLDEEQRLRPLLQLIKGSRYYARYRLEVLADVGSPQNRDVRLDTDGRNLFTVLRNWRDLSEHEARWDFVFQRMRALFPWLHRFDFDSLARRVVAQAVHRDWKEEKLGPTDWADGFFMSLLHLTALASSDPGGVVAIDEPENSLHPALVRAVIEAMRDWSAQQDVTVLLATHSPVVLDCFREEPDQVYVMEVGRRELPVALTELQKREWLDHYSLGDLYAQLEVGAP
jgi:predicted ATPase